MTLPAFIASPNPEIYLGDNYVVVDVETTNIEFGSPYEQQNRLLLACWILGADHPDSGKDGRVHHRWGSEFEQSSLLWHIGRADFIVAHHTKFELGWLARCGLNLRGVLPYCTQIGEYVIAGNRKLPGGLGLEAACGRHGIRVKSGTVPKLISAGVCPSDIPPRQLQAYCAEDVRATEVLFKAQRSKIRELGLLPVTYCRNIVTPCLADIEPRGMCLAPVRVEAKHKEYAGKYAGQLAAFQQLTGGINPKSGKQMREYLYTKLAFEQATDHRGNPLLTKGGKKGIQQARTDKKVLPLLKASTPEQKEFKQLAIELAKLKVPVQNLVKMKKILSTGERIVYGVINQTIVDTHRFSSAGRRGGFQFHNFDRAFKDLFCARTLGWSVVEADAPQLEFRAATHMGDDSAARRDIIAGADIHAFTAAVLKIARQAAKEHTFKPLYGGQSGTPAEIRYYKAFREKYPDIYRTQQDWVWEVAKTKQLRIPSGLIFYFPDTVVKNGGYVTNTPKIFNYPIQSFATADIIPLTLVLVWHHLEGMETFITNTIHDSIIAEVPPFEHSQYKQILVKCFTEEIYTMLEKLYGVKFSVPLGVGIKSAEHWGEGTEEKFEPTARKFCP